MGFKEQFGKQLSIETVLKLIEKSKNVESEKIEKKDLNESGHTKIKKIEIVIGRQLLLMHYLELIDLIKTTNQKKAVILSVLFNTEGSENIRRALSNIGGSGSRYQTKENLEFIFLIFEKLGLDELKNKVLKDINKLPKK